MRDPKEVVILVVDDEEALRSAIAFDFKKRGFQVLEAGDGKEAFAILEKNHVDVILSDVRMPKGDGLELLDRAKALNPELPVVMLITGFADISLEEAYDRGADAIFSKPFDRKHLIGTVMQRLSTKEEIWSQRKEERIPSDYKIEMSGIAGRVLNLGRGGIFVGINGKIPPVGTQVSFKIDLADTKSNIAIVEGRGVVRWTRVQTTENFISGCGIEFEYLSDESRTGILSALEVLKGKPFIPRK